jgi:hypothetical protein
MSETTGAPSAGDEPEPADASALETAAGGPEPARWEVAYEAAGLAQAEIFVGRLHAEGIPAMAWQEGAGRALAVTVGLLGTAYVVVPPGFVQRAREVLGADEEE